MSRRANTHPKEMIQRALHYAAFYIGELSPKIEYSLSGLNDETIELEIVCRNQFQYNTVAKLLNLSPVKFKTEMVRIVGPLHVSSYLMPSTSPPPPETEAPFCPRCGRRSLLQTVDALCPTCGVRKRGWRSEKPETPCVRCEQGRSPKETK